MNIQVLRVQYDTSFNFQRYMIIALPITMCRRFVSNVLSVQNKNKKLYLFLKYGTS